MFDGPTNQIRGRIRTLSSCEAGVRLGGEEGRRESFFRPKRGCFLSLIRGLSSHDGVGIEGRRGAFGTES